MTNWMIENDLLKVETKNLLSIDPPEGWKYGFPKFISQEEYIKVHKSLRQWCIDNGYPANVANFYGHFFFVQVNGDLSFMKNVQ